MHKVFLSVLLVFFNISLFSQECYDFLNDTAFVNASISFIVRDASGNDTVLEYDSGRSLKPASVLKLFIASAALEQLGPKHTFRTTLGYTGKITRSGRLSGDLVITGGGDPSFASPYFPEYYTNFPDGWISEIKKLGIKRIKGRVITDDSYFDYLPLPSKWLWEDAGNYYGAGVYGTSVYDNTLKIHLRTTGAVPVITGISPDGSEMQFINRLKAEGTTDKGYVFAAPYSNSGWLAGSVPVNKEDFVLKASISDPPLFLAGILHEKLISSGIKISGKPTTVRIEKKSTEHATEISSIISPPLDSLLVILNHESVNLYAETLLKELGKKLKNEGSVEAGIKAEYEFLRNAGVDTTGLFLADGSGLSPINGTTAGNLVSLLIYMSSKGKYFPEYLNSLPDAGKEGTLKRYFQDPAFAGSTKAKSGSMTRVKSYAGYITTFSGRKLVFAMIINNFSCAPARVNQVFEEVLKELIMNK